MTPQTEAWWQSLPPAQGGAAPPPAAGPDDGIPTITVRPQAAASPQGGGSEWWQSLPAAAASTPQAPAQPPPMGMLPWLGQGLKEGVMGLANTATAIPHAITDLATGALGLKNPVQQFQAPIAQEPQGFGESAARAIGQGLPTLPLLGAGEAAAAPTLLRGAAAAGRSMLSNAAPIIVGQVGGEAASEAAPEPLKPAAQMLGALATGGGVGGVQALGEGLARGGWRAAGSMGLTPHTTFQAPGGDAVRATEQQVQAARGQIEAAANQTPGGATRFQQMLEPSQSSAATQAVSPTGPNEIVPGSQPTTAQVAPLPGIAKLEDTVRATGGGPTFMQRAEEQNAARVGAIQGLKPQADPAAVGQFFKDQMAALDAAGEQQVGAQRGAAQQSTEALGGRGTPAAYGQEMRGAIQGALDPVQAQRRALWNAVDPDGTLALHADPVRDAFNQITQELTPSDALTGGEKAVLAHAQDIAGRNGAIPYSELQSFRSNILSAQRQSAFGEPLSTQGMRRLTIMKNAVDQSVADAVSNTAKSDPGVAERLTQLGQAPVGVGSGESAGGSAVGGAASVSGASRAQSARAPGSGGIAGAGGVETGPATERKPESLTDFLIAKGGVQDQGGDLRAIGADAMHHRQGGRLVNPKGVPLDYAREAAEEAGFLRPNSTTADLLDSIANETGGRPTYRLSEQAAGEAYANQRSDAAREAVQYDRARTAVGMAESDAGARLSNLEIDHATRLTMLGMHPEQAIREAVRTGEELLLTRNAQLSDMGQTGVPFAARQAEMPISGGLKANFDAAAAERDAVAREATFREKERFGRGPVGQVLARGKAGTPNNVLDADVPAKFFTGRPSEPAQVESFLKAVGTPRGEALARDYLVSDLRRRGIIDQDGTLNAKQFATWQQQRGETIKMFPDLGKEFAGVEAAQRTLNDVQASHAGALKDYQNGVAKHFLNEEPGRAVQKILGSADRVKQMQQAIGRLQGNPDAVASLKGHVIDYILDKLTNSPKATEGNAAAPNITDVGSLRPDAFKDWVAANNPWLKRLFGGQGMQSLEMVGADLRRQQLRGIASSGSPTVERGIAAQQHGSLLRQHLPTVMALLGEKIAETGAGALGMHGVAGLGVEAAGMALPVLAHALRQRGIQTTNDLVREAMLHPSLARELMARPKQATIGNVLQRRIAHNLLAVTASQANSQESHQ